MALRLARRFALLTLLWWVISGGGTAWAWGLPAILVTALVMPTSGAARLRPLALLAFLPLAGGLALRGGLQVAALACRPRLDPATRVIDHPWRHLPEGPGRLFMASLINLIPGTLTLRQTAAGLQVHVLRLDARTRSDLDRLEARVAGLFTREAPTEEKEPR
ncbi:Na+/H+ antiporter subunit E [Halomonas sp. BM-2019]|uniref:Na+/H+ antiporter subunit E n=1 Tax=Halomonas sp. BM-2019 TaxID=2811227 RepID=UPI001B3C3C62|nr:MAG: Na+/H+ antiporter subunit E [Halomonas sp. BM-2019]